MKIAYRTNGGSVLLIEDEITSETLPTPHLQVTRNGGSRQVLYTDFLDLTSADVRLEDFAGPRPEVFKSDTSHTWDGTQLIATGWEPETSAEPIPYQEWAELQFRRLFTQDERIAIEDTKAVSKPLRDFDNLLQCAGRSGSKVSNDDADLVAGLEALKLGGLISAERKDQILRGIKPE